MRFDDATIARFDAVAQALSERASGLRVARTDAVQLIVDRGLPLLERELGIAPTKPSKTKAPRKR